MKRENLTCCNSHTPDMTSQRKGLSESILDDAVTSNAPEHEHMSVNVAHRIFQ